MMDFSSWTSVKDQLPKTFKKVQVAGFDRPVYLDKRDDCWKYLSGLHAGFLHANNLWKELEDGEK